MGFGTLFFGYCLLLNITYYAASDVFAGLIMLMALLKLSAVNSRFSLARWLALGFSVFGFCEFSLFLTKLLFNEVAIFYDSVSGYIAVFRYALLAAFTLLILLGMEEVSREVGLERIPARCRVLCFATLGVYVLWMLLDLPLPLIPNGAKAVMYFIAIILMLTVLLTNLFTIYGCYMRICMPGEEDGKKKKPSRFAFVNEYRERQEQRAREEEEYRREMLKRKRERRKKK